MKISPAKADGFLAKLDDDVHAVLFYGPDAGLVRERAEAAARLITGGDSDPFLLTELTAGDIREDPARVTDEACALAFGGGRRAVRLRGAADGAAQAIASALEALAALDATVPSLLIAEAGELGPRSSLRKLFEGADHAAAIACYKDEGLGLERIIKSTLNNYNLHIDRDALAWLASSLGADRGVTLRELEKLALYCAGQEEVSLEDCLGVAGEGSSHDLEEAAFAAAGGEGQMLERVLTRAFQEGASPIGILRSAQRHFQRLHQVTGAVADGSSLDAAIKGLRPPVFFKVADRFRAQARRWPAANLARALDLLTDAELKCKTTGMPDRLICQRTLMQIANAARRSG